MKEIDCRGMTCPQPVITTKQALEELKEDEFILIVDNPSSCENVKRFALSQGCSVEVEGREGDLYILIQKGKIREEAKLPEKKEKMVVYINSHLLGVGDEALGRFLMKNFLKTFLDLERKPDRLILLNSGVLLAAEGSETLDSLIALSEKGVEIFSCGTCLDFYKVKDKLKVGTVSNMYEIIQSLVEADRVIRP
ncbi:MAG: sulfurtransferase-like selenium metabolism protein YedF [Thermodesulfobacteriota bacterium]|nr:sulfurtransferase-like selenium metabolism protein YedF [Thermodesulfobacteriota bacterium]